MENSRNISQLRQGPSNWVIQTTSRREDLPWRYWIYLDIQIQIFTNHLEISPRCSMYGIFTYIWAIFGVNVGKYSIHGASGDIWIISHSPNWSWRETGLIFPGRRPPLHGDRPSLVLNVIRPLLSSECTSGSITGSPHQASLWELATDIGHCKIH